MEESSRRRLKAPSLPSLNGALQDERAWLWAVLGIGAVCGLTSLWMYRSDGYGHTMLWLWLSAVFALTVYFWRTSAALPRIAPVELLAALGSTLAVAPLYLVQLYRYPVQMSSDEVTITRVAQAYVTTEHNVDPFGLTFYFSRPTLLFLAWGRLGQLFGGFDLYHMRLLHAVFGLISVAAAYVLFRQLLPLRWSILATVLFGASHAYFMISRLAMRENTSALMEIVALTLLLWGLRNDHALATFAGGVVAGLGFYVYFPARATFPIWLLFLVLVAFLYRKQFAPARLLRAGAIAVAGFVLIAGPVLIAESHTTPGQTKPNRETFLLYPEGRKLQQQWVFAPTEWEGVKKNIKWGLGTFNNKIVDHGFIYENKGHGFVDPLTGLLLWLGIGFVLVQLIRQRADEGRLLLLTGFLVLWLSSAFVINKAPNYTRLMVTLPLVAFFVTEAIRRLAGTWRSIPFVPVLLVGVFATAIVIWNLTIAWDFVERGNTIGEPVGNTGRYIVAHRDIPGIRFYLAGNEASAYPYYVYGSPRDRLLFFASNDYQVPEAIDPGSLGTFNAAAPFALFMRRDAWTPYAKELSDHFPTGRIRNVTPDGTRIVLEVLPSSSA